MNNSTWQYMGRTIIVALVLISLGACAGSNVKLSEQDRSGIRKAPVINVVRYVSPGLSIQTPAQVAGKGLIASSTGSENLPTGAELARKYAYPEPTLLVATRVAEQLRTRGRLTSVSLASTAEPLPVRDELTQYRSRYTTGLVLEISMPVGYMMSYQPFNWETYQFTPFGIRARIIDPKDGRILWQNSCNISKEPNTKFTIDVTEFEANNGARAKDVIQTASRVCADQLLTDILGTTQ